MSVTGVIFYILDYFWRILLCTENLILNISLRFTVFTLNFVFLFSVDIVVLHYRLSSYFSVCPSICLIVYFSVCLSHSVLLVNNFTMDIFSSSEFISKKWYIVRSLLKSWWRTAVTAWTIGSWLSILFFLVNIWQYTKLTDLYFIKKNPASDFFILTMFWPRVFDWTHICLSNNLFFFYQKHCFLYEPSWFYSLLFVLF